VVYRLVVAIGSQSQLEEVAVAAPPLFWFDGITSTIFSSLERDKKRNYPNVTG
jgi:hypothetical protein